MLHAKHPRIRRRLNSLSTTSIFVVVYALAVCSSVTHAGHAKDKEIKDDRIARAIESELWGAKGVNANQIDVKVQEGIVTLNGKVNNLLSQESAVRIAKMTKGVRSVVSQLQVKAWNIVDKQLRGDVQSALSRDPATDSWELQVDASKGKITLTGTVESYAERELAGKVAKSVKGVEQLDNKVNIKYRTDRSDYEIQQDIQQRLNWDSRLDDELVTVTVKDGKVTLSGSVGSDYEKSLARSDAWVGGTKSVNDEQLTVEWWSRDDMQRKTAWPSLGDDKVVKAIKDAFVYDPRVFSFNPEVSVENGVATLTGVVDNLKAKRAAAQDAKNTIGIYRVKNYLKVRPAMARSDDEIASDLRNSLLADPIVDRFQIVPSVRDGAVYLYGDVDSYFEKQQAGDLASKVNGVTDVHNHLTVTYGDLSYPLYPYYDHYDWDPTLYDYDFDYSTTRSKPDNEIKEEIDSQLWWSPWVDSDAVTVSVADGVATLTGMVDTWSERDKAAENAIEGGAVKVVNKLDVQY